MGALDQFRDVFSHACYATKIFEGFSLVTATPNKVSLVPPPRLATSKGPNFARKTLTLLRDVEVASMKYELSPNTLPSHPLHSLSIS